MRSETIDKPNTIQQFKKIQQFSIDTLTQYLEIPSQQQTVMPKQQFQIKANPQLVLRETVSVLYDLLTSIISNQVELKVISQSLPIQCHPLIKTSYSHANNREQIADCEDVCRQNNQKQLNQIIIDNESQSRGVPFNNQKSRIASGQTSIQHKFQQLISYTSTQEYINIEDKDSSQHQSEDIAIQKILRFQSNKQEKYSEQQKDIINIDSDTEEGEQSLSLDEEYLQDENSISEVNEEILHSNQTFASTEVYLGWIERNTLWVNERQINQTVYFFKIINNNVLPNDQFFQISINDKFTIDFIYLIIPQMLNVLKQNQITYFNLNLAKSQYKIIYTIFNPNHTQQNRFQYHQKLINNQISKSNLKKITNQIEDKLFFDVYYNFKFHQSKHNYKNQYDDQIDHQNKNQTYDHNNNNNNNINEEMNNFITNLEISTENNQLFIQSLKEIFQCFKNQQPIPSNNPLYCQYEQPRQSFLELNSNRIVNSTFKSPQSDFSSFKNSPSYEVKKQGFQHRQNGIQIHVDRERERSYNNSFCFDNQMNLDEDRDQKQKIRKHNKNINNQNNKM